MELQSTVTSPSPETARALVLKLQKLCAIFKSGEWEVLSTTRREKVLSLMLPLDLSLPLVSLLKRIRGLMDPNEIKELKKESRRLRLSQTTSKKKSPLGKKLLDETDDDRRQRRYGKNFDLTAD
jgi:hypothetical protein